jgi:predicted acylesterase/phospholipase RssA
MIKHLVIAGGGQTVFQSLGALFHLEQHGFFFFDNIESIYGTSAGALLAAMICLKFDWNVINNYVLKRPWHKIFPFNIQTIFEAYGKKGIYDDSAFRQVFKPLFEAKDISLDITLKELYEYSKISIHIFAFEVVSFEKVELSHILTPDLPLIKALHMSCALPVVFSPVFLDGKCYIDGGLNRNYPLEECLQREGIQEEEVVGFSNDYKKDAKSQLDEDTNIINFIMSFFFRMVSAFSTDQQQRKIKNEIRYPADTLNVDVLMDALYSVETRQQLFKTGEEAAAAFLSTI